MRIALRTSGGRGEYELAGHHAGVSVSDLYDRALDFQLSPALAIAGGQAVRHIQGKSRIRLDAEAGHRHAYRLLAAALLLPAPKRELRATGTDADLLHNGRYAITDIDVEVASDAAEHPVLLRPTRLWLKNASGLIRSISVPERMALVQSLWDAARSKDTLLAAAVRDHETAVVHGSHQAIERAAAAVQRCLATDGDAARPASLALNVMTDGAAIGPVLDDVPLTGTDDETDPLEAKRRVVGQWRKSVARNSAARTFSQRVRAAYGDRCLISGDRLPKMGSTLSPGVDGAHILPWARYELHSLTNGMCLNKLCHWAFDAALLRIDGDDDGYRVSIPSQAAAEAADRGMSLAYFEQFLGPVPVERLPRNRRNWPSAEYLAHLNAELYAEA